MGVRSIPALWLARGRMNVVYQLRGGREALMYLGADLVVNLGAIGATFLIAQRFGRIGNWATPDIIFMLGYAMVVNGLLDTVFNYNLRMISRRIGRGQLDHSLLQPQPLWIALLTEGFSPFDCLPTLAVGIGLMAWAGGAGRVALGPGWLGLLALNLLASCVVVLAIQYGWGSLAFWAPRAAEEINSSSNRVTMQLSGFPLDSVGRALGAGLLTLVPVGLVAWLPCRALLAIQPVPPFAALLTPAAALVLGAVVLVLFRSGLRHYAHTGSSRYLTFGFRR